MVHPEKDRVTVIAIGGSVRLDDSVAAVLTLCREEVQPRTVPAFMEQKSQLDMCAADHTLEMT
ncbi:MAG: hypothetical protein FD153_582 [Rhodospirillaceae bacterium]|nr:MAG: hypothetical protein FD153_582 [Rhodospirillaceae bacterium]